MAGSQSSTHRKRTRKRTQRTDLTISQKHRRVIDLKVLGFSDDEIADEVGYASPSAVWKIVDKHMKELPAAGAELLRRTCMARIEKLSKAHLPVAQGWRKQPKRDSRGKIIPGELELVEGPPCPKSAMVVLKCIERTENLFNLTVKRVELTGADGSPLLPADLSKLSDEELRELADTAAKDPG